MTGRLSAQRSQWLCVVCGIVERDDALLLVRQKARDESGHGWWAVPGGVVEVGETLERALQRELREETGLRVDYPDRVLRIVQTTNQSQSRGVRTVIRPESVEITVRTLHN